MVHCSFLIFRFIYLQLRLHLSFAFLSTLIFPAPFQIPGFFVPNLEDVTLNRGGGQIVTFAISIRLNLIKARALVSRLRISEPTRKPIYGETPSTLSRNGFTQHMHKVARLNIMFSLA